MAGVFHYFRDVADRKVWLVTLLLVLSNLSEGLGIAMLLPILMIATGETHEVTGNAAEMIAAIEMLGIPIELEYLLLAMVVAIFLKTALRFFALTEADAIAASLGRDLRLRLLNAIGDARWSYFVRQSSGQLANTVSQDSDRVGRGVSSVVKFLSALFLTLLYFGIALWISWVITVAALGAGLATALVMRILVARARAAAKVQTLNLRSLIGELTDMVVNFKPIKAMGAHRQVLPGLEARARRIAGERRHEVRSSVGLQSLYEPILVVLVAIGVYAAITWSSMTLAELLFTVALFQRVMTSVGLLQGSYQIIARYQPSFAVVFETLAEAEAQKQVWPGDREVLFTDRIELDGVSFSYDEKPVLTDLSLAIRAGELTTFLGPSGSGKTTCVDLVCGLYRPDVGRILVDGTPLDEISLEAWRSQIGYVPQDPVLFNTDIAGNVALLATDIDRDALARALDLADASDFVGAMAAGAKSLVGEHGMALSGGQRQRLAIARALYRRPRLLILDEATSALDPQAEAEICATLERLKGEVTMLAISHRPAIGEVSDRVYRFSAPARAEDASAAAAADAPGILVN